MKSGTVRSPRRSSARTPKQPARGLLSLHIQNYALIENLTVEFGPGLNVLTGETGTGKSIILGALNLLLGERPDPTMIRSGADSALVEGTFVATPLVVSICAETGIPLPATAQPLLVLRRRITGSGRNNAAWANDVAITVTTLARIGDRLVDLHGQHQHQLLLDPSFQLDILDEYAGLGPARQQFGERHAQHAALVSAIAELDRASSERAARRELTEFQLKELAAAAVQLGEAERLRQEQALAASTEKRWQLVAGLRDLLAEKEGSLLELLAAVSRHLSELGRLDPKLANWQEPVSAARATLDDLWRELVSYADTTEYSPERVEEINGRLFLIEKLERKYGVPAAELPELQAKLQAELDATETDADRRRELAAQLVAQRRELTTAAVALSQRRQQAARKLVAAIAAEFRALGLTEAKLTIAVVPNSDADGTIEHEGNRFRLTPLGIDTVSFSFCANPGEELRPLRRVASGGEISRLMLAIKTCLAQSDPVPSLVFDEIDAGIGGRVAEAVGLRLRRLATDHQVICITHLPQIAQYADRHLLVAKTRRAGRNVTAIQELHNEGRVRELARMTSGAHISATSLAHARELVAAAQADRD